MNRSDNSLLTWCIVASAFLGWILAGGWCIEYSLETWLEYVKGTVIDVPYWICCLISIPLGGLGWTAAILTWIIMMFL